MSILVPTTTKDGWKVQLSDGREYDQDDAQGHISAWLRLKEMCKRDRVGIVRLALVLGDTVLEVKNNAVGYWQAQKMFASLFGNNNDDPDLHWRGIGYVDDDGIHVHIKWIARPDARIVGDPSGVYRVMNRDKVVCLAEDETRLAVTQNNIIWNPNYKVL